LLCTIRGIASTVYEFRRELGLDLDAPASTDVSNDWWFTLGRCRCKEHILHTNNVFRSSPVARAAAIPSPTKCSSYSKGRLAVSIPLNPCFNADSVEYAVPPICHTVEYNSNGISALVADAEFSGAIVRGSYGPVQVMAWPCGLPHTHLYLTGRYACYVMHGLLIHF
jgi:hypothetical protein